MLFNLNDFLRSVSNLLDVIEIDILGVPSNHSKRIAYISLKLGQELNFAKEEVYDLVSLAILHDNGASLKILHSKLRGNPKEKLDLLESMKEHCIIGEDNIRAYPFITSPQNVIKYHHENYDGSGFFKLSGDSIPIMSQIICFADKLDLNFALKSIHINECLIDSVINFVHTNTNKYFSQQIADAFLKIINQENFWYSLSDQCIDKSLVTNTPCFSRDFTYEQIHNITITFSKIIDAKSRFTRHHSSELSKKLYRMASFYKLDKENRIKLLIAADLHDVGKLAISNDILDKPESLSFEEFEEIKKHPAITRKCLQEIEGFEDITEWASNHHEKLNGQGYPRGLTAKELDFNSRLLACLDIYQALREDRSYRPPLSHEEAISILVKMAIDGFIDNTIVEDISYVFSNN